MNTPEPNPDRLPRPDLILFDLDGTLVDSVPDLTWCIDKMLTSLDLPPQGEQNVRLWVGNGVNKLVQRALAAATENSQTDALMESALPLFDSFYSASIAQYSAVYPGVLEFLQFIRTTSVRTGCVTNKPSQFTIPMLEILNLDRYFDTVVCGDTVARMKPDPLPLLTAAERLCVPPSRSLMVGDSENDVTAARKADMRIICMADGYNHGKDISLSSPDAVLSSMMDLKTLIDW